VTGVAQYWSRVQSWTTDQTGDKLVGARSEGPQHVTVHGRDEVVIIATEELRRLKGEPSGEALIAALRASPRPEIDIEPERTRSPVREVGL
jgi:hypothetical protein